MNSFQTTFSRPLAILFILLISTACSHEPLPEVPAFEELGFEDALNVVRRQMVTAYDRLQVEPRSAERNGKFGMLLSAYAKNGSSEIFYQRARLLEPTEFRWAYYLGVTLSQLGRYEEAAAVFREALTINPDSIEARVQLAAMLFQNNNISESIELYQAITAEFPERVDGWLGLGKALDRNGDFKSAIDALRRAKNLGVQYGDVRYALAAALSASGDKDGAARELAAYEKRANYKVSTSDQYTQAVVRLNASDGPFLAKADYQISRGQYGEAVNFFRRALEINPVNQDAWGGLVFALSKLGKKEATATSYKAALDAGIIYKRIHFTYGQALRNWQQFDEAHAVIGEAIKLDPQYTEALIEMGELQLERGESASAAEHYRRATKVVPNDRNVQLSLAQALMAAGQYDEAATELETLTSDPAVDQALALKELAIAYHGMNRKDKAIATLQRAREAASKAYRSTMVESIDALRAEW